MSLRNENAAKKKDLVVKVFEALSTKNDAVSAQDVVNALAKEGYVMSIHNVRRFAGNAGISFTGQRGRPYTEADVSAVITGVEAGNSHREIATELGRTPNSIGYKVRDLRDKGKLTGVDTADLEKESVKLDELLNMTPFLSKEGIESPGEIDVVVDEILSPEEDIEPPEGIDTAVEDICEEGDEEAATAETPSEEHVTE